MAESSASSIPYRQIRALYDADTITVYQAYSAEIGDAAVAAQKLNASPLFKHTRMTWVKPSWCWMMYRAGYSFKDAGQARILALKMKHEHFRELLSKAQLAHSKSGGEASKEVVTIQWDPERDFKLEKLSYRSIQIGIPAEISKVWVQDWIVSIEDVTEKARDLKKAIEQSGDIKASDLVTRKLLPLERVYDVSTEFKQVLAMSEEQK
jgi:hypothetical protein